MFLYPSKTRPSHVELTVRCASRCCDDGRHFETSNINFYTDMKIVLYNSPVCNCGRWPKGQQRQSNGDRDNNQPADCTREELWVWRCWRSSASVQTRQNNGIRGHPRRPGPPRACHSPHENSLSGLENCSGGAISQCQSRPAAAARRPRLPGSDRD